MSESSISPAETAIRALREARIAKRLTQAELAEAVGCTQSAVSRLEAGNLGALGDNKIRQVAELLGVEVDLKPLAKGIQLATASARRLYRHCASPWCPSCIPYTVRGGLRLWPVMTAADPDQPIGWCTFCGEPLKDRCWRCSQGIDAPGAFCAQCGAPRVRSDDETAAEVMRRRRMRTGEAQDIAEAAGQAQRLAGGPSAACTFGVTGERLENPPGPGGTS